MNSLEILHVPRLPGSDLVGWNRFRAGPEEDEPKGNEHYAIFLPKSPHLHPPFRCILTNVKLLGPAGVSLGGRPNTPWAPWKIAPEEAERMTPSLVEGWWQRLFAWMFLIAGGVTIFWVSPATPSPAESFMSLLKGFILLGVAQAGLMFILSRQFNDVNMGPGLKRVKAKVPVDDAVPAAINMTQKGTRTGADEGYLWFDDGTLYYKGLQCVFRLNREDILPLDQWPKRDLPRFHQGVDIRKLHLNAGSRSYVLGLQMIDPFEDFGTRRKAHRFQHALADWLADRPQGGIESVLPPLDVHPSLMHEGPGRKEGVVSGVALVLFNLAVAAASRPDQIVNGPDTGKALLHFLASLGLTWFAVRFAWQQYLDLNHRKSVFLENELSAPV